MNAIKNDVVLLTIKEMEHANLEFPLFQSNHETAGVILEELEELEEAVELTRKRYHAFWTNVRSNYGDTTYNQLARIRESAIDAAVEAIQVAAMAQKGIKSMEGWEKEHEK